MSKYRLSWALCTALFLVTSQGFAAPQQKIKKFYLLNCKQDGNRDWEIKGEQALLYEKYVDIKHMKAHYYLQNDTITVLSEKAKLDKKTLDIYLKDNVRIKNSSGATLTTNSLNWEKNNNLVHTTDWAQAKKDSFQVAGQGMTGDTELKNVDFIKNVEAQFQDAKTKDIVTIHCQGPLKIEYNHGKAIFHQAVVMKNKRGTLYSDKATLYFDTEKNTMEKVVAEGNVKVIKDENMTLAEKAIYFAAIGKLIFQGNPRMIYTPQDKEKTQDTKLKTQDKKAENTNDKISENNGVKKVEIPSLSQTKVQDAKLSPAMQN